MLRLHPSALIVLGTTVPAFATDSLFHERMLPDPPGAIGDFDGDGALDRISLTGPNAAVLHFHRGNGAGGFADAVAFTAPQAVILPPNRHPIDLNGDGFDDAIGRGILTGDNVVTILGGPAGIAGFVSSPVPSYQVEDILDADYDGDGKLDLVLRHVPLGDDQTIRIALGTGAGGFTLGPVQSLGLATTGAIRNGDIDSDGDIDLVRGLSTSALFPAKGVATFVNQGIGTFVRTDSDPGLPTATSCLYLVQGCDDFTGDGRADILAFVKQNPSPATRLALLTSQGPGIGYVASTPLLPTAFAPAGNPEVSVAAVGDLNADGRADTLVHAKRFDGIYRNVLLAAASPSGFATPIREAVVAEAPGQLTDFDGDGAVDFVNGYFGTIVDLDVLTPDDGVAYPTSMSSSIPAMTTGDFDSDGDEDVVATALDAHQLLLFANDGAGGFAPPINLPLLPNFCVRLRAVHHDAGNTLDLVLLLPDRIAVLWNDGAANFTLAPLSAPTSFQIDVPPTFVVDDLDGNGIVDAINATEFGMDVSFGSPLGFGHGYSLVSAFGNVQGIATDDIDGDRVADIVTVERAAATQPGSIVVYHGQGTSAATLAFQTPSVVNPSGIAAGDFDHDGFADVAAISRQAGSLMIHRSTGTALSVIQTFAIPALANTLTSLRAIDVTQDGWLDLVAHGDNDHQISIWLGHAGGTFDSAGSFATHTGSYDVEFADFDGDGAVDFANSSFLAQLFEIHFGSDGALQTTIYGSGKAGANGIPTLLGLGAPLLRGSSGLRIEHGLAGAIPLLFVGSAPAAIPFDLGTLLVLPVGPIFVLPMFPASGILELPLTLPSDPALRGIDAYFQSIHVDPAAAGANHTAQSNGLHWRLGF